MVEGQSTLDIDIIYALGYYRNFVCESSEPTKCNLLELPTVGIAPLYLNIIAVQS